MKRDTYHVAIVNRDDEREIYATATRYDMDSGIRAGEDLLRNYVNAVDMAYFAEQPTRDGDTYRRIFECEDDVSSVEIIVIKAKD